MRRALFALIILFAVPTYSLAQATSADAQTLQALLSEVRSLRQELRVSLNRSQSMQILLARFQIQEGVITRASDRLNEARQKLLETRTGQKQLANELKRLEDALNTSALPQQQADLQDRMKHVKSDLEIVGNTEQQQQATETGGSTVAGRARQTEPARKPIGSVAPGHGKHQRKIERQSSLSVDGGCFRPN